MLMAGDSPSLFTPCYSVAYIGIKIIVLYLFISAKIWLYEELAFSFALQYVTWVLYSLLFIMFATGFTHLVSPQAIGKSGFLLY